MQPLYNVAATLGKKRQDIFHIHLCENKTATFEYNLNTTLQQRWVQYILCIQFLQKLHIESKNCNL
jgi:hypothetical protein